jgi:hypothetical protein
MLLRRGVRWAIHVLVAVSCIVAVLQLRSVLASEPVLSISSDCFGIRVIDAETHLGVPLVEFETVHRLRYDSDNLGYVAIDAPELMDREVHFSIRSPGYAFEKDGFGFAGKTLRCKPGTMVTLEIQRTQPAQRLHRATGGAKFVHARRLGVLVDEVEDGPSVGCDSVLTTRFGNDFLWFWGDTAQLHYPIGGSFHMTGATSAIPDSHGRLSHVNQEVIQDKARQWGLEQGPVPLKHFVDEKGRARPMAQMPGDGPTWLLSLVRFQSLSESDEQSEMLFAPYVKIRSGLQAYRWGFARWDATLDSFVNVKDWDTRPELFPVSQSHAIETMENGISYVVFCSPFPHVRVRAQEELILDPSQYEGFTCLMDGTKFEDRKLDRDSAGVLHYRWRRGTSPLSQEEEVRLVSEGRMQPTERRRELIDIDSNEEVTVHNGSVAWNPARSRWCMVFSQLHGKDSVLGNVYYAESLDRETGPWRRAKRIAGHPNYSFYNPKLHPEFFQERGNVIFFEGTYSHTFSGNPNATPRYDYNQLVYRLDLQSQDWLSSLDDSDGK